MMPVEPAITLRTNGSARMARSASVDAVPNHLRWVDDLVKAPLDRYRPTRVRPALSHAATLPAAAADCHAPAPVDSRPGLEERPRMLREAAQNGASIHRAPLSSRRRALRACRRPYRNQNARGLARLASLARPGDRPTRLRSGARRRRRGDGTGPQTTSLVHRARTDRTNRIEGDGRGCKPCLTALNSRDKGEHRRQRVTLGKIPEPGFPILPKPVPVACAGEQEPFDQGKIR